MAIEKFKQTMVPPSYEIRVQLAQWFQMFENVEGRTEGHTTESLVYL